MSRLYDFLKKLLLSQKNIKTTLTFLNKKNGKINRSGTVDAAVAFVLPRAKAAGIPFHNVSLDSGAVAKLSISIDVG